MNPGVVVTPDNLSPVLEILSLLFLTIAILAVFARLAIKSLIIHSMSLDDYFILASLVGVLTLIGTYGYIVDTYQVLRRRSNDMRLLPGCERCRPTYGHLDVGPN